ncbi:hypothetical protein K466DRAFT_481318 [Polyporus arcularius HHB13444]|uniref:RING-type domain-containing protein n=1 Tax=Polyporus arcularius HHB13444 TaxID=1314778 RepID=A0A5C3PSG5_9APHY|nr:hypothetical protein K466DRAFT_481318 [Polyporus arcularius HHB13444]
MLVIPNAGALSEYSAEVFQRTEDELLAGSSRPFYDVDTLAGAGESDTNDATNHTACAPTAECRRTPSPLSQPSDDGGGSPSALSSSSGSQKQQTDAPEAVPTQEGEPLAAYTCPICFSAPTHATITPCGHVLCGECLFTAVKTSIQRGAYTLPHGEHMIARCPVCRAPIPGWDGRGGGIIGLKPRAVFSL